MRFGNILKKAGNFEFVTKVYDQLVVKAADFMMNYRDPETHAA